MPQFFFFDLLLISSMSSPGALADYHSLHLLSGSKGSRKENRGSGRGQTQGEGLGHGDSAELLAFTALVWDAAGCRVLWDALGPSCTGMQGAGGCWDLQCPLHWEASHGISPACCFPDPLLPPVLLKHDCHPLAISRPQSR